MTIQDKIQELKGRPTISCSHTDYDTIKSQKDSLQIEVESKKRKIYELENKNVITKKVLIDNTNWKNWGIELSNEQKQKIRSASSANELETARSEIIKTEFSKLKDKSDSSFKLTVGLGILAVGSLLILAWVLMKQNNNNSPEMGLKKTKEP